MRRRLFTPRGLKLITYLATFAAGAVAHEYFAGQRMWEYHAAEAAAEVAEAEVTVGAQAEAVVANMAKQLDAAGVDRAKLGERFEVTPEQKAALEAQTTAAQAAMQRGRASAGNLREISPCDR